MNDDQMIKWYAKRAAENERLDALARAAYERDRKAAEYVCLQIENAALRDEAFDQQTELVHLRAAMRKQSQAIARKIDNFRVQIDILQAENAELRTTLNMISGGEHYTGIEEQVCLCGTCRFGSFTEADARLIAAAPELLEALQLFMGTSQGLGNFTDKDISELAQAGNGLAIIVQKARAAIAKATEES